MVGGTTALASLSTAGSGKVLVYSPLVATTGAQAWNSAVTVGYLAAAAHDFALTSTAGPISFTSTLDGTSANLSISTGGSINFAGAVGGSSAFSSFTFAGGDVNGGSVTASTITQTGGTGTTTFTGTLKAGQVSLTGDNFSVNAVTLNTGSLSITDSGTASIKNVFGLGNGGFTKQGPGGLTLSGINSYFGVTVIGAGVASLAAGASLTSASVTIASGATFNVNGDLSASATQIPVQDNGTINFGGSTGNAVLSRSIGSLSIGPSALATVTSSVYAATPGVLHTTSLAFADNSSKLDLTNNELVTTETLAAMQSRIVAREIFTSSTGGAVGCMDLGGGQVEARFTLLGDTNLDGKVDVTDLGNLASSYGASGGALWVQGDTNYDGNIDVTDLGNLASSYGGALASGPGANPMSAVAVPEPAAGVLVTGLVSVGAISRRRRRDPAVPSR
jgi:hypothetical protein